MPNPASERTESLELPERAAREKISELEATLGDEEAAHQETLEILTAATERLKAMGLELSACAVRTGTLLRALRDARHVIDKGIKVRMGDQWPVLRDILPDTLKVIDAALATQAESGVNHA